MNDVGDRVRLEIPSGSVLPPRDSSDRRNRRTAPADPTVVIAVSPTSKRLQLLAPFPAWDGADYVELPVLAKARGKCTTDQISAAGKWLNYRGHLEHISDNLFLGVVNAFTGVIGEGKDPLDGSTQSLPQIAEAPQRSGSRLVCRSATRTTAKALHASTRPWSRATAAASSSSLARSPGSTRPT